MRKITLILALLLSVNYIVAQSNHDDWKTYSPQTQSLTADRLVLSDKGSFGLSVHDDLQKIKQERDELSYTHHRYQQYYRGYPVEGAQLLVHENNLGLVYASNGGLIRGIKAAVQINLNEKEALQKALQHSKASRFAWEDEEHEQILRSVKEDATATFYPKGELVWAADGFTRNAQDYRLCYKFDVFALEPLQRDYIFVDAATGEVVASLSQLCHIDVPATGIPLYACNVDVKITADSFSGGYRLREANNRRIETYNSNNTYSTPFSDIISATSFDNSPNAVAVHWGTEMVFDYYKNIHGRTSYNNANATIFSWVDYGINYNNAFWNGTYAAYGKGNGTTFTPLVSLDVVGHELTHAVTQHSANLAYSNESGALNESFSDIFGAVIEFETIPTCADWKMGEDITPSGNGIRNMQNPNLHNQPDTYQGQYWYSGSGDNGGVHYNSGVQNFWFYLLSQGGSGTNDHGLNYTVSGIGLTKSAKIAYRMLTVYMQSNSVYADARNAAINAATDLYGVNSPELNAVLNAWCAVGVGTCTSNTATISVSSPNGGEVWQAGTTKNITWSSSGTINNVKIEFSTDEGAFWQFLADVPNTAPYTYSWIVPNIATALARVRISDIDNNSITDISDDNFVIQTCGVIAGFNIPPAPFCSNTSLSFMNSSVGATSFQWKINGANVSTASNLNYNFTNGGTYIVSLTANNGTCSDTYTQTIQILPATLATFTHITEGLTFSGFAAQAGATAYSWNFGDGSTAATQNTLHTYNNEGTYNICLTVTNTCGNTTACQTLIFNNDNTNCISPAIEWQNTIGGSGSDGLYSIQQTTDGGYILGGYSDSNISGDKTENSQGSYDYWVVKLDVSGNIQWQNTIGGSGYDELLSVQQTTDGGYILGGYSASNISGDKTENSQGYDDYWVVKLDASGNIQWQNTIGGSGLDELLSVQQTTDGGYILGGISESNISGDKTENSQGGGDYWVVKLDASGKIQWQNTIGGGNRDNLYSIQQTTDGGYILGGYSNSNISGDKTENSQGTYDYWVVKLDASGNIQWQNTIGGSGLDQLYSIQQTTDGGYILGGTSYSNVSGDKIENSQGYNDYWVVKLDASGNIQWQNTIGGNNYEYLNSISQTTDGGYILGGTSFNEDDYIADYWVVKLDASGNIQWQNTIGGSSDDKLFSVQQTTDGGYILGGYSYSGISGDKTENSLGNSDYWVIKLAPDCNNVPCSVAAQFSLPAAPNCSGTTYTFTNNSTGGVTAYQWKVNGNDVSTATNLTHTFAAAGTYTITLEASNGSCSDVLSQEITINGSVNDLELGEDIIICGEDSIILDCGVSDALFYIWDKDSINIGNTQSISITESGTYHISVMDACNQVAADTISVVLDDDCVWPGDANNDNIVNYLDLLPIGLNYGYTGAGRANASLNWEAQPCPDWGFNNTTGVDMKHSDCDGNGIIDNNDPNAILINYGETHGTLVPAGVNSSDIIVLETQPGILPPAFSNNTLISMDIYLNNTQNATITSYGVAFRVYYDIPNANQVNSIILDFNNSWLGTYGVDMTAVYQHFPTSTTTGYVEVAITRLNRQNRVGSGKICTAIAEVDLAGAADQQTIDFTLEEQQMVVAEGYFIPVGILGNMGGNTSRFALYNPTVVTPCQTNISLSGILTNGTLTYQASIDAESIQQIQSGVMQVLSAGEKIVLNPGFNAQAGCDFRAYIAPCSESVDKQQGDISSPPSATSFIAQIAPNPAADYSVLSFQSTENGTAVIEVFDLQGRNVLNGYRQDVEAAQNYQIYFHTAGLPAGLYFVKIQIQGKEQIFKMIKE